MLLYHLSVDLETLMEDAVMTAVEVVHVLTTPIRSQTHILYEIPCVQWGHTLAGAERLARLV